MGGYISKTDYEKIDRMQCVWAKAKDPQLQTNTMD